MDATSPSSTAAPRSASASGEGGDAGGGSGADGAVGDGSVVGGKGPVAPPELTTGGVGGGDGGVSYNRGMGDTLPEARCHVLLSSMGVDDDDNDDDREYRGGPVCPAPRPAPGYVYRGVTMKARPLSVNFVQNCL